MSSTITLTVTSAPSTAPRMAAASAELLKQIQELVTGIIHAFSSDKNALDEWEREFIADYNSGNHEIAAYLLCLLLHKFVRPHVEAKGEEVVRLDDQVQGIIGLLLPSCNDVEAYIEETIEEIADEEIETLANDGIDENVRALHTHLQTVVNENQTEQQNQLERIRQAVLDAGRQRQQGSAAANAGIDSLMNRVDSLAVILEETASEMQSFSDQLKEAEAEYLNTLKSFQS